MRTRGLIIHPSLEVIRAGILLGKGLSSSPAPCATPSARGEPNAPRSHQGVTGHPLHTSVKCCLAPATRCGKGYSHRGSRSRKAVGETPSHFKPYLCSGVGASVQTHWEQILLPTWVSGAIGETLEHPRHPDRAGEHPLGACLSPASGFYSRRTSEMALDTFI